MIKNYTIHHLVAGFITVLVGFTASVALIFQAAQSAGATVEEISSWISALSFGIGFLCIYFSLRYKMPVLVAWSTPGAAILISGLSGFTMAEATGAFVFSSLLMILFGLTGWFDKIINRVPTAIASAMLAGVLLRFSADVFTSMKTEFVLSFSMFIAYLLMKRWIPKLTMLVVLVLGIGIAIASHLLHFEDFHYQWATPVWVTPAFNFSALISLGIPLFIVTMTSQNIPGITILRAFHFHPPPSKILKDIGFMNLLLAPFGAYALNLAAITAAICLGKEVDEKPERRYLASVTAGIFYLLIALMGGTVAALFSAFPKELIMTVAGLALFSTIASSLGNAMKEETTREPALMTFLVAASGLSFGGIGAAFWALIVGVLALFVFAGKK